MRPLIEYRNGLRVFGHPLHTILIHFPLAFWFLVFPLEVAGLIAGSETLWRLAFLANIAAVIAVLPTAVTGLADLIALPRGSRTFAKGLYHMSIMLAATVLFVVELLLRGGSSAPEGQYVYFSLGLTGVATLVLAFGSWMGGELVFGPDAMPTRPGDEGASIGVTK